MVTNLHWFQKILMYYSVLSLTRGEQQGERGKVERKEITRLILMGFNIMSHQMISLRHQNGPRKIYLLLN